MALTAVYHSCLLVTLVPFCNCMIAKLGFKVVRATVYLKAIMEVYRNTFTSPYLSAIKTS